MHVLLWLSIGLDRRSPSEHLLTAIVEALYEQGHTVHILQKDTGGKQDEMPPRMVELGVTTTRIKSDPPNHSNLIARYLKDIAYVLRCKAWLRNHPAFDRVFLQSSNVAGIQVHALQKVLKNVPILFNVQDIFPENAVYSGALTNKGLPYRLLSALQKYAYRHVERIITISEDMKDQLVELGAADDNIEVVYNWSYQDEPYDPEQLDFRKVAPYFDKTKFHVVYAGNIGRMQNVELMIRAAAQMRQQADVDFHVFGEGVDKPRLIALAKQLNADNVAFHPMLDSKDAPALYASADVNVIPLAKDIYRTALPSKTATCLACGKPIILAIGKEARFGQSVCKNANVQVIPSDDEQVLIRTIISIKQSHTRVNARDIFTECFAKTKNSRRYAELITH